MWNASFRPIVWLSVSLSLLSLLSAFGSVCVCVCVCDCVCVWPGPPGADGREVERETERGETPLSREMMDTQSTRNSIAGKSIENCCMSRCAVAYSHTRKHTRKQNERRNKTQHNKQQNHLIRTLRHTHMAVKPMVANRRQIIAIRKCGCFVVFCCVFVGCIVPSSIACNFSIAPGGCTNKQLHKQLNKQTNKQQTSKQTQQNGRPCIQGQGK